jgi:hypothetical protein
MVVTLSGMVTEVREEQYWNAEFPIVVTLFPMVTEFREEQPVNALSSMVMTLSGMITDVIKCPLSLLNAEFPICIVGYPPRVEGIVIFPPAPVYPVIVATPPLIE